MRLYNAQITGMDKEREMKTFVVMLTNGWTTMVGLVGGLLIYLSQAGLTLPTSKAEMPAFVQALAVALLGFVAKSATTGSKPQ